MKLGYVALNVELKMSLKMFALIFLFFFFLHFFLSLSLSLSRKMILKVGIIGEVVAELRFIKICRLFLFSFFKFSSRKLIVMNLM